jgi:hypothetical protein
MLQRRSFLLQLSQARSSLPQNQAAAATSSDNQESGSEMQKVGCGIQGRSEEGGKRSGAGEDDACFVCVTRAHLGHSVVTWEQEIVLQRVVSVSSRRPSPYRREGRRATVRRRKSYRLPLDRVVAEGVELLRAAALDGVARVENQPAVLEDEVVVEALVVGEYHDAVGRLERLGGERYRL